MTQNRLQEVLGSMVTALRPWPARHVRKAAVAHAARQAETAGSAQRQSEASRARAEKAEREIVRITRDNPAITSEIVRNLRGNT